MNLSTDSSFTDNAENFNSSAFAAKQKVAFKRSIKFIARWLDENNVQCHELFFDKKLLSEERDAFEYIVRAVDNYNARTYIFHLFCIKNKFLICYSSTSQNPEYMLPGDKVVRISDIIYQSTPSYA
jgi:hypothetical protein